MTIQQLSFEAYKSLADGLIEAKRSGKTQAITVGDYGLGTVDAKGNVNAVKRGGNINVNV